MNLQDIAPSINHQTFCKALEQEFSLKWNDMKVNKVNLNEDHLK